MRKAFEVEHDSFVWQRSAVFWKYETDECLHVVSVIQNHDLWTKLLLPRIEEDLHLTWADVPLR